MGKLAEAIYAVPPDEMVGEGCKVRMYLDALPPDDSDVLRSAITTKIGDSYAASAARIALAMSQTGTPLGATLINQHRSRQCRCYRKVVVSE